MKNLFFAFLLSFSLISADSPEKINELPKQAHCECATADSWCRGVANRAVWNFFQANPNGSFEDAWNLEMATYIGCMAVEIINQEGNVW